MWRTWETRPVDLPSFYMFQHNMQIWTWNEEILLTILQPRFWEGCSDGKYLQHRHRSTINSHWLDMWYTAAQTHRQFSTSIQSAEQRPTHTCNTYLEQRGWICPAITWSLCSVTRVKCCFVHNGRNTLSPEQSFLHSLCHCWTRLRKVKGKHVYSKQRKSPFSWAPAVHIVLFSFSGKPPEKPCWGWHLLCQCLARKTHQF